MRWILLLLSLGARAACASDYYVDCNYGSNGNAGTTTQTAWRTLLKVGISSFQPGDSINLLRGCTWNETLTPPSSGTNPATGGALIKIDSYGSGQAPHLTGSMPIGAKWWTQVPGTNVWAATLYSASSGQTGVVQCGVRGFYCLTQPPSQIEYVRFGTVWGNLQSSQAALGQDRDFWYDATTFILYVYSAGGNPANYLAFKPAVAPIVLSGETVLNLNGVSWLEIQHLQIDWFDSYGVQVQGLSDHLWLANMASNSEVENSTVPLGFYVQPTGTPVDIHLYNTDANMNYMGYSFKNPGTGCSGGGCYFEIKNCRAYGNRTYGIMDAVDGAVNYDYCHLYGNYLATALAVDVAGTPGPTAGTDGIVHNIPAQTPPWIRQWQRWPAYTTVTFDDPGLVEYSDSYVSGLLPMMSAKKVPLSIAVVTNGSYSQSIVGEVQGWINAGWDINTHSVSHQYWNPPSTTACDDVTGPIPCDAFLLAYVGAGTYTMSITHSGGGGNLTLTTSPYDANCYHSWDLTPVAPGGTAGVGQIDTIANIVATLQAQPDCYAVDATAYNSEFAKGRAHAYSLADTFSGPGVAGAMTLPTALPVASSCTSVPATPGCVLFDETHMETDEMSWALAWFGENLEMEGSAPQRLSQSRQKVLTTKDTKVHEGVPVSSVQGSRVVSQAERVPFRGETPIQGRQKSVNHGVHGDARRKPGLNQRFTGLAGEGDETTANNLVYVMPGTYGNAVTENIAASLGFKGVRGTGSMSSTWVLGGADTTLAKGYDGFNILSQGIVPNYQGLSYQAMRNLVSQDLFKNALWGRPIGYFWHVNELRPDEVANFMDGLVQGGATLESNTGMVNLLAGCAANDLTPPGYVAGSYAVCPSSGVEADFRPTGDSPVRDAGVNLGAEYQYDLMGVNQNLFGTKWEIGAFAYVPERVSASH